MGEKHAVKLGLHMVEDGKKGDKDKLEMILCLHSLQFNALEIKTLVLVLKFETCGVNQALS